MTAQIVEIAGQKIAMLPAADYLRLLELAEEQSELASADRAEQRRLAGEEYVPFELIEAIVRGESPVRTWRTYRGLTQTQLAVAANTRKSTISEIESGKAQGKPALWRALAEALDVTVDDILPNE
jgi:DNA-binding XRE family transcriptional regulator